MPNYETTEGRRYYFKLHVSRWVSFFVPFLLSAVVRAVSLSEIWVVSCGWITCGLLHLRLLSVAA